MRGSITRTEHSYGKAKLNTHLGNDAENHLLLLLLPWISYKEIYLFKAEQDNSSNASTIGGRRSISVRSTMRLAATQAQNPSTDFSRIKVWVYQVSTNGLIRSATYLLSNCLDHHGLKGESAVERITITSLRLVLEDSSLLKSNETINYIGETGHSSLLKGFRENF